MYVGREFYKEKMRFCGKKCQRNSSQRRGFDSSEFGRGVYIVIAIVFGELFD